MGDLIQFVPRARTSLPSERAKRMIAEARAQYQAIFPDEPAMSMTEFEDAALYKTDPAVDVDALVFRSLFQSSELLYTPEDTAPFETNPDNLA